METEFLEAFRSSAVRSESNVAKAIAGGGVGAGLSVVENLWTAAFIKPPKPKAARL
jgi:hypothetical protein